MLTLNLFLDKTGVPLDTEPAVQNIFRGVDTSKFFRYSGSLTTPDCNEVVQWTVFKDPIKISASQVRFFNVNGKAVVSNKMGQIKSLWKSRQKVYIMLVMTFNACMMTCCLLMFIFKMYNCTNIYFVNL